MFLSSFKMRTVRIHYRVVFVLILVLILAWISFSSMHSVYYYKVYFQSNGDLTRQNVLGVGDNFWRHFPVHRSHLFKNSDKDATDIINKITTIAKFINNAKKHVRGSKTSDFLMGASETMNSLLVDLNLNPETIYNRTTSTSKHVCPETYKGTTYGYPYFYKGFEVTNCKHKVAIWKLVTIIKHVNFSKHNTNAVLKEIKLFLSSVYRTDPNYKVLLSVNNVKLISNVKLMFPTLSVVNSDGFSDGSAFNMIVNSVKTPYVFVARNAQMFTNDSRLERLVREIEVIGVKVAGGAFRNSDGHWKKGCFQAVYRNFTLKYLEGYDESLHECLFCDYIQSPFVTSKAYLQNNMFENLNETEGLFEEWFLRISQKYDETITCPDSMFHVTSLQTKYDGTLLSFMKKWNLFKVVTPYGRTVIRSCAHESHDPHTTKALSPCSVKSNAHAVKTILRQCEKADLICELQEGTALGAVKLGKTLPWERDADITFLTANYSGFQKLETDFLQAGFNFSDLGSLWCCVDNRTAGGKFMMSYIGWNIELYGQHIMDSELLMQEGNKPTKVFLDGQWVNVPRNPGLFVRNRYGREIYQHAEHWISTGKSDGWINYKTNVFARCVNQGDHDCLDRYNADGDLQFIEMLP